jgi:hypothetical protein
MRTAAVVLVGLVLFSTGLAVRYYRRVSNLFAPARWEPMLVYRNAQKLKTHISSGPVLTLSPTGPLEAGLEIYPAFSTGPFAWRVASFIESRKRTRLGIVSDAELEEYLRTRPPEAILLGDEEKHEGSLAAYAHRHGYQPVKLTNENVLWLRVNGAVPR